MKLTETDIFIIKNALEVFIDFHQNEIKQNPTLNHSNALKNISIARDAQRIINVKKTFAVHHAIVIYNSLQYLNSNIESQLKRDMSYLNVSSSIEAKANVNSVLLKLKPLYEFACKY